MEIEEFLKALLDIEANKSLKEEEKEEVIPYQHIEFKRDDLVKMVRLSSTIINLKSTQVVPKAITIVYDELGYKMVVNNDLEYVEYRFEVLNKENRLVDTICLPIELLNSIIKLTSDRIVIYKNEGLFIKLLVDGDLFLELPEPEPALLRRPISGESGNKVRVSCQHLREALKATIPIAEEEIVLDRKKLVFLSDRVYVGALNYFMEYKLGLPEFKISLRFAKVLEKICSILSESGYLEFDKDITNSSRVIVKCGNLIFTSLVNKNIKDSRVVEFLNRAEGYKDLLVDFQEFGRIISMAYSLPNSKKEVRIKYNKELIVSIPTRNKINVFKVSSEEMGKSIGVKKEISIPVKSLKKLVDSFSGVEGKVVLTLMDTEIVIRKGNLVGILII